VAGPLLPAAAGRSDLEPGGRRKRQAERREPPRRRSSPQQQIRPPMMGPFGRPRDRRAVRCLRGDCSRLQQRQQRRPEAAPSRPLQTVTSRPSRPSRARSPIGRPRVQRTVLRLRGDGGSIRPNLTETNRRRIKETMQTRESAHLRNESEHRRGKRGPALVVGADAAAAAASAPAAAAAPHAAVAEVWPVRADRPAPAVHHHISDTGLADESTKLHRQSRPNLKGSQNASF